MCSKENEMWNQIMFREYLIVHPKRAKEYEHLKIELAANFKNDRVAYRVAKSDFVNKTIEMANEASQ